MARSAYGFDTGPDTGHNWRLSAACRTDPELWFAYGHSGKHSNNLYGFARHICLRHCPVLTQCRADANKARPKYGVQAGLQWWGSHSEGVVGQPFAIQPPESGCGSACWRALGCQPAWGAA